MADDIYKRAVGYAYEDSGVIELPADGVDGHVTYPNIYFNGKGIDCKAGYLPLRRYRWTLRLEPVPEDAHR